MNSIPPIRGGIFGEPEPKPRKPITSSKASANVYVVAGKHGVIWSETARTNRREAIKAAVALTGQTWEEMKADGFYTAPATLTMEKKTE